MTNITAEQFPEVLVASKDLISRVRAAIEINDRLAPPYKLHDYLFSYGFVHTPQYWQNHMRVECIGQYIHVPTDSVVAPKSGEICTYSSQGRVIPCMVLDSRPDAHPRLLKVYQSFVEATNIGLPSWSAERLLPPRDLVAVLQHEYHAAEEGVPASKLFLRVALVPPHLLTSMGSL